MKRAHPDIGLGRICGWLGYTRQAYYAQYNTSGFQTTQPS